MRKFVLAAVALAFISGAATHALACDQGSAKATAAKSSSCSTDKAATASSCPAGKAGSTVLTGAGGSCSAQKSATAAGAGCSAHKGDVAAGDACCLGGDKCANYVIAVADMDECCVEKIEKALSGVKNVQVVYVDAEAHKAWVCTGTAKFDQKAAVKSVKKAGFKQVTYAGTDSEHCAHAMRAAKEKSAAEAKSAS